MCVQHQEIKKYGDRIQMDMYTGLYGPVNIYGMMYTTPYSYTEEYGVWKPYTWRKRYPYTFAYTFPGYYRLLIPNQKYLFPYMSTFHAVSVTVYVRNLRVLLVVVCKTLNKANPELMGDILGGERLQKSCN